ncbi:MAG: putative subunit of the Multisubunit Na+/H+ antiporter [Rhodobacteraceae bacterium HLUCCA12]|nr:MAG: putative subunit of the Multisubunit Na+/H+ antiporter [Rhodobacteraceae bacterium HLUCCA12]
MAVFDLLLCALILLVAVAAIVGKGLFRAVVFFVIYGVLLSLAWVRLDAPDVALAEVAIGAGLTGVLLLGAVGRLARSDADEPAEPIDWPVAVAASVVAALLVGAAIKITPGTGLEPEVRAVLTRTGVENPVTAILMNLRAWDTLLESMVLITAVIGLWPLAQGGDWMEPAGPAHHAQPGGVLSGFGRLLPPVALLVGVYLLWAGASQPGGAFQGGTVLAAAGVLCVMAGVVRAPGMAAPAWRLALVAGPAVFAAFGVAGLAWGGFLTFPEAWAKGAILTIEMALTLSIAVVLALLVLGPPQAGEAR